MSRHLFATLLAFVAISIPNVAAAQCDSLDGTATVQPGDTDPSNSCFFCDSVTNMMENLPAGTRCGDDQEVHCDATRVWVARCVEETPGDESTMDCDPESLVGPSCPEGYLCDLAQQACKQSCAGTADCQAGWECSDANTCERLPPPDMGSGGDDDMGSGGDDMGMVIPADMGSSDDMGGSNPDSGGMADMGMSADSGKSVDGGGCCATNGSAPSPPVLLVFLFGFFFQRRLRGRVRESA